MRLSRKRRRNFRSWTPETSRLAHQAKERKRLLRPVERIDRPEPGRWLETIRIERPDRCLEIKVFQAPRLNQIYVEVFGTRSKPMGWDLLHRRLRQRSVVRWLHE